MDCEGEQFNENVNAEVVSSDVIRRILASPGGTLPRCALCCDFLSSTDEGGCYKMVSEIYSNRLFRT